MVGDRSGKRMIGDFVTAVAPGVQPDRELAKAPIGLNPHYG